jgi:Ca2+-binding EF-hand superfamily protein
MFRLTKTTWVSLLIFVLVATGAILRSSVAQKASVPRQQDRLALGEVQVRQLILLMDTDKNGKVSKREYMSYMEAEFDRLDKDKSGDLDVNELKQSSLMASNPAHVYAGK